MVCKCSELIERMEKIEKGQESIAELIELLHSVKSALKVFIVIGRGFKWLAGIVVAGSAIVTALRKWV